MSRAVHKIVQRLRQALTDSFVRNSVLLILNYPVVGLLGFVFWAFAARTFPAAEIGNVTALLSGLTFVSVAAGLGLQNTIVRYLASEPDQRALVIAGTAVVAGVSVLATLIVIAIPGHLGLPVLGEYGPVGAILSVVLVVLLATGVVTDATMIGLRATGTIVVKNAAAGGLRIALLPFLTGGRELALLACLLASAAAATSVSLVAGLLRSHRNVRQSRPLRTLSGKLQFSAGNYAAMLLSVGPLYVLPVWVVNILGSERGAYFSVCVLLITALNAVPSTISQSLFAELATRPNSEIALVGRAFRIAYALVTPIILLIVVLAPFVLRLFGSEYTAATFCLQLMALGGLFGAFNYVADVVLNAAGRIAAFTIVNVTGAIMVLGLAMALGVMGLAGVGVGWLAGQIIYSILAGAALIRCGLLRLSPAAAAADQRHERS